MGQGRKSPAYGHQNLKSHLVNMRHLLSYPSISSPAVVGVFRQFMAEFRQSYMHWTHSHAAPSSLGRSDDGNEKALQR